MTIQLFARYSKFTTYVSVAPIPSDIIIYAFFSDLEALEGYGSLSVSSNCHHVIY